jgi:SAM-dependent methyltransferase
MSIGSVVRTLLGPFESRVTDLYRDYFVDLEELARTLARLTPVERILEVGCGGGQMANQVSAAFPEAEYLGIDVMPDPGTLFTGDSRRATFRALRLGELPPDAAFDLALFVDVLHHVPPPEREDLLREAHRRLRPGGFLVIKEWERRRNLAHLACYLSDRFISGSPAWFPSREELLELLAAVFPSDRVLSEARIPPKRNNLLLVMQKRLAEHSTR